MTTTTSSSKRRYPASLSHNPSGPSRPSRPQHAQRPQRPVSRPQTSVDDEVPSPPDLAPLPKPGSPNLPELASLEHLLQQAGYKETRVFTPESERMRPRLKPFDNAGTADLYRTMGLDPDAGIHVRHLTKPIVPMRSSSSVLRSIALQDASSAASDAHNQQQQYQQQSPEHASHDSWWGSGFLSRAAQTVGKSVSAMSPPATVTPRSDVGLGLALGGNGVRKAKSNAEFRSSPGQEDIPLPREPAQKMTATTAQQVIVGGFDRPVPPSIAALFSPPDEHSSALPQQPTFDDDAFGYSPPRPAQVYDSHESEDLFAYGLGDGDDAVDYTDDDADSVGSSSTYGSGSLRRETSPPLLDVSDVFAELGLTSASNELKDLVDIIGAGESVSVGQRVLATTVEYDEDVDLDSPPSCPSPTMASPPLIPTVAVLAATPSPPWQPCINIQEPTPPAPPILNVQEPTPPSMPMINVQEATPPSDQPNVNDTPVTPATGPTVLPATPATPTPASRAGRPASAAVVDLVTHQRAMSKPLTSTIAPKPEQRAARLRAAQSTPALRFHCRRPKFCVTPAVVAAPAVQTISPVLCDSVSSEAEDLPLFPLAPAPPPPKSNFGTLTLRAKQSLSALRAYWAANDVPEDVPPSDGSMPLITATPILTPRIDWAAQGFQFAGWNQEPKLKKSSHKSTDSTDTMAELGDPFDREHKDAMIDYTKSFFYKPPTPPRPVGAQPGFGSSSISKPAFGQMKKRRSVKSLRAALEIPVAPVPQVPSMYRSHSPNSRHSRSSADGTRTPTRIAPAICVHSPDAWEEGRPGRELVLEGHEWDGHDYVPNWGSGVRRGKGKTRAKRSRGIIPFDDYQ